MNIEVLSNNKDGDLTFSIPVKLLYHDNLQHHSHPNLLKFYTYTKGHCIIDKLKCISYLEKKDNDKNLFIQFIQTLKVQIQHVLLCAINRLLHGKFYITFYISMRSLYICQRSIRLEG